MSLANPIVLWCSRCHTGWREGCWRSWQACPFRDCDGVLQPVQPGPISKPQPKPADAALPLLDFVDGDRMAKRGRRFI